MNSNELAFILAGTPIPQPQPDQEPTPEQLQTLPNWAQSYIDRLQERLWGAENRTREAEQEGAGWLERVNELSRRRL